MKKLLSLVMIVALVASAIGIGVLVPSKDAYAVDLCAMLDITWGMIYPYDVQAIAWLYDANHNQVAGPITLTYNSTYTSYTGMFFDIPMNSAYVVYSWTPGVYDWGLAGQGTGSAHPTGESVWLTGASFTLLDIWPSN